MVEHTVYDPEVMGSITIWGWILFSSISMYEKCVLIIVSQGSETLQWIFPKRCLAVHLGANEPIKVLLLLSKWF